jgi:hypothetical protein
VPPRLPRQAVQIPERECRIGAAPIVMGGTICVRLNFEDPIMQYMLLIYGDEKAWAALSEDDMRKTMQAYVEFSKALAASGALRGGSELAPISSATTVRVRNGRTLTTDGPFAETKEQLGGYYLVDVANLDEAIRWAAKIPSAGHGSIEIRPLTANQAQAQV